MEPDNLSNATLNILGVHAIALKIAATQLAEAAQQPQHETMVRLLEQARIAFEAMPPEVLWDCLNEIRDALAEIRPEGGASFTPKPLL